MSEQRTTVRPTNKSGNYWRECLKSARMYAEKEECKQIWRGVHQVALPTRVFNEIRAWPWSRLPLNGLFYAG